MAYLVNSFSAQAYRGQSVNIIMDGEYASNISNAIVGLLVQNNDGIVGIISEVDSFGNSFKISPLQPNFRFDSIATPGILQPTDFTVYTP